MPSYDVTIVGNYQVKAEAPSFPTYYYLGVVEGASETYKNASYWKEFQQIEDVIF